ncbi:MAG TPA: SWIM zinc finger family protein, partial [Blastocatellia bacterium]|nr:SWIM zinc finger family protein [Blastocatellia bacterium]
MYLTSRFSSAFEKRVRSRGQSYFEARFVNIVEGSKEVVRAVVRGSYEYDVSLKIVGLELLATCTCPYYDHDLCKHIWATMLAAERKGYLMGTGYLPSRLVMSDEDFDGEDDGYDTQGGYDDAGEYRDYEDKRPATPSRLKAQPIPKPWRRRIETPT